MPSEIFYFAKYHTFYFQNECELSTCPCYQILKKNKGGQFASCGSWGLYGTPDTSVSSDWNFLSWAGTGPSKIRATCSSPRNVGGRTGFELGLQSAVFPPLLAQTTLKKHGGGMGQEKGRDILPQLIPLTSNWTWEWGYRFQSLCELRNLEVWLLCAWKSGFYPVWQIRCSLK